MTKLKFVETSFNAVTQENICIQTKSHWKTSQRDFDDKKKVVLCIDKVHFIALAEYFTLGLLLKEVLLVRVR